MVWTIADGKRPQEAIGELPARPAFRAVANDG